MVRFQKFLHKLNILFFMITSCDSRFYCFSSMNLIGRCTFYAKKVWRCVRTGPLLKKQRSLIAAGECTFCRAGRATGQSALAAAYNYKLESNRLESWSWCLHMSAETESKSIRWTRRSRSSRIRRWTVRIISSIGTRVHRQSHASDHCAKTSSSSSMFPYVVC